MVDEVVPRGLYVFATQDMLNEVSPEESSAFTRRGCGAIIRCEWKNLQRMEMVDRSCAFAEIDAQSYACIDVSTGVTDCSADRLAVRKITGDCSFLSS